MEDHFPKEFLKSYSAKSPKTLRTYTQQLEYYHKFSKTWVIDKRRFEDYMAFLAKVGRSHNGMALACTVLVLYGKYYDVNTARWQRVIFRRPPVEWIRPEEMERLRRAAMEGRSRLKEHNRFMLDFLTGTGLRINEYLSLKWSDIDMDNNMILVRSGKGGIARTIVPLKRASDAMVDEFWRQFPTMSLSECRDINQPVSLLHSEAAIWRTLQGMAKRAGMETMEIHPHLLRHTFATTLTLKGVPQAIIQRLLGHRSPVSTSIYQNFSPVDIVETLKRNDLI